MRLVLWPALGALALAGCGPSAPKKAEKGTEPPPPAVLRKASTGPVKIEQRDDRRRLVWSVDAKESQLSYGGENTMRGTLEGVSGTLYRDGAPASRFTADRGSADQATRRLDLEGRVRVTAEGRGAVLTADRLRWIDARQVVEAEGDVRVVTQDYEIGPIPRLWATPDLRDVGTPETFAEARK